MYVYTYIFTGTDPAQVFSSVLADGQPEDVAAGPDGSVSCSFLCRLIPQLGLLERVSNPLQSEVVQESLRKHFLCDAMARCILI